MGDEAEEKKKWLKSIGAAEFPEPVKYIYTFPDYSGAFNLSEHYIRDTLLEELKAQYEKNKAYVQEVIKSRRTEAERTDEKNVIENLDKTPFETCCFTKDFARMMQLFQILTANLDFSKPFRIVVDYNPEWPRTSVKKYMPTEVLESCTKRAMEIHAD